MELKEMPIKELEDFYYQLTLEQKELENQKELSINNLKETGLLLKEIIEIKQFIKKNRIKSDDKFNTKYEKALKQESKRLYKIYKTKEQIEQIEQKYCKIIYKLSNGLIIFLFISFVLPISYLLLILLALISPYIVPVIAISYIAYSFILGIKSKKNKKIIKIVEKLDNKLDNLCEKEAVLNKDYLKHQNIINKIKQELIENDIKLNNILTEIYNKSITFTKGNYGLTIYIKQLEKLCGSLKEKMIPFIIETAQERNQEKQVKEYKKISY